MATTDFPPLVVSLSMLAAPYRGEATGDEVFDAVTVQPVQPAFAVEEDVFAVDSLGDAVELEPVTVEPVNVDFEVDVVATESETVDPVVPDLVPEPIEADAETRLAPGFADSATDESGDLLDEDSSVAASVPMPPPPATAASAPEQSAPAVPYPSAPAAGPPPAAEPGTYSSGEPLFRMERAAASDEPSFEDVQPLLPHSTEEDETPEDTAPALDPNIAAIVFPKTPATTEAPVPSVAGFDPSRYFNFDDSEEGEEDLNAGSEFGVPPRAANSPEALKALKELSAFRDR